MTLLRLFKRISATFEQLGATSGLLYLVNRAFVVMGCRSRIYRYLLVAQPVTRDVHAKPGRGHSIDIRQVLPGDPSLAEMPLSQDVLDYRYGQGSVCFGAFNDSAMTGCLWLCLGSYNEDEVRCRFTPAPGGNGSWDFDVYVLPEWRISRTFARLWEAANAYLQERDVAWSFSRISAFNPVSLSSHRRLGAEQIGVATYFTLGRWQFMISSLPPRVYISTGPDAVPELKLHPPMSDRG